MINSAKTILFAPGQVKNESGVPLVDAADIHQVSAPPLSTPQQHLHSTYTIPAEEPFTVEDKSLAKIPEEDSNSGSGGHAVVNKSGYTRTRSQSYQPIQFPLRLHVDGNSDYIMVNETQDDESTVGGMNHTSIPLSKKSSSSETQLTVVGHQQSGQEGGSADEGAGQDEIWTMLQKDRGYVDRNIYSDKKGGVQRAGSVPSGSRVVASSGATKTCEDNQKTADKVVPLALRRESNPLTLPGSGMSRTHSSGRRLRSPTAPKPGGLRLKTDYSEDHEIIFSSSSKYH